MIQDFSKALTKAEHFYIKETWLFGAKHTFTWVSREQVEWRKLISNHSTERDCNLLYMFRILGYHFETILFYVCDS